MEPDGDARGSVSRWIEGLKAGDPSAAGPLWDRYFQRLVALARNRLAGKPRQAADEEDVALAAFDSFCRAAGRGGFARLDDRDDLWQVLAMITLRKAVDHVQAASRQKRGGGRLALGDQIRLAEMVGREPSPELAAEFSDELARQMHHLGADDLRSIARWKLDGFTNLEIARRLDCAPRTVERKLCLIRKLWETVDDDPIAST
jgi:DNA-directed RNA polymerase specialized sigma24 family protein